MNLRVELSLFPTEKGYYTVIDEGPGVLLGPGCAVFVQKKESKEGKPYLRLVILPPPSKPQNNGDSKDDEIPF